MAPFTPPPADEVRGRLLVAARDEFAAVGLVAARVERIAAAAASNRAQLFHYFGGKEGLFDAVVEHEVATTFDAVPLDVEDLPGYAASLSDAYAARPWVPRLLTWYRLERQGQEGVDAIVERDRAAAGAIERAQRAGVLPRSHRPAVLLGLVLHLAAFWSAAPAGIDPLVSAVTPPRRRQIVVDAVTALLR